MSRQSWWRKTAESIRSRWMGPYNAKDPLVGAIFGGKPTGAGVTVTERTALDYSPIWAAVQRISGDVGSLPLVLYRRTDGGKGREPLYDHPTYRLLHDEPNPEMTSIVFKETLQGHLLTWGNAYAEIEWRKDGLPFALWPLTPDRVTPQRDRSGRLSYRVSNYDDNRDVIIQPEDMLHIPGMGYDGTCGYSPIRCGRESIALGIAAERFGSTFFGNGSTFGGFLTTPNRLGDQARENLRKSLEARHQGTERAHKLGILEEGLTYQQIGVPPDDAQFLETRKFQVTEIARWFQIPPHMLGDLERATFTNIEQQQIDYYTGTLRRWLERWEQEINRKLILQRNVQFAEHVIEGLLRGDIESRYRAYAIGRQWGWFSVNDIRGKENMNPVPDGDTYLVPQNMAPADRVNDLIDAQVRPTPASGGGGARQIELDQHLEAYVAELKRQHEETQRFIAEKTDTIRTGLSEQDRKVVEDATADAAAAREAVGAAHRKRDELQDEWRKALEAHAERLAAEAANRASAETALKQQSEMTVKLEGDVAEQAKRLDAAQAARDALQTEWRQAQASHAERMAAEASARAQLQAALDRQVEIVSALEGDVADKTRLLDAANAQREDAEKQVTEARELAAQALSDKAVSLADAQAARELVTQAEAKIPLAVEAARVATEGLGEARAARALAESQLEDLRARLEALRQDLSQTQDEKAAQAEAALKLQAELQHAQSEIEAERIRAEQANDEAERLRQEKAEIAARVLVAESALERQRREAADKLSTIIAANRRQYVDAVARLVRMEVAQAERHKATPEKLRNWLKNLALTHEARCIEVLSAHVAAHLAFTGAEIGPGELTRDLVREHIAELTNQLLTVADSDPSDYPQNLDAMLRRWETERPDAVADALMRQEIEHVRALG